LAWNILALSIFLLSVIWRIGTSQSRPANKKVFATTLSREDSTKEKKNRSYTEPAKELRRTCALHWFPIE
jgi:hypothetical protein